MNKDLQKAKREKNDEFFTRMEDIEKELPYYWDSMKGKIIYCNCDDPMKSNFWKYLHEHFHAIGLSSLWATYKPLDGAQPLFCVYDGKDEQGKEYADTEPHTTFKSYRIESGDFNDCEEFMNAADIIITNPPYSKFRTYFQMLEENNTRFLIVGSVNAMTYPRVAESIAQGRVHIGLNNIAHFETAEGLKRSGSYWYSNIDIEERRAPLIMTEEYDARKFPKFDNYDAISVNRVKEIPFDYMGAMGVPVSFIEHYDPDVFDIIGNSGQLAEPVIIDGKRHTGRFYVNGKRLYDRIVIKRKA